MSQAYHIHPTSQVHPTARLGHSVRIGPYVIVEQDVILGDDCQLEAHAIVKSQTVLGRANYVGHGAVLGGEPQHRQAGDRSGSLVIGEKNLFREYATVHRGLKPGHRTTIGSGCMIMVAAHVAHDCQLADDVILANNVLLAGHVSVGRRAYLSGAVAVHQFCRIGSLAMVGGQAHINQDVPPCVTVDGQTSCVVGLNTIGLRRAGIDGQTIQLLKQAYRLIYRGSNTRQSALAELAQLVRGDRGLVREFYEFLVGSQRGFLRERHWPRRTLLKIVDGDPQAQQPADASCHLPPAHRQAS